MTTTQSTARLAAGDEATRALGAPGGAPLVLDRYRLVRRLGAGGFGVVWLARDERLEREVAVKVVPREGAGGGRVAREARAAARLNHPGIVALYELAADEHEVYLVSELVRGRTLAELMRAGAVSDRDVARIGGALCEALEHAHGRGVIHRDVKPQNVMVVAEPAAGAGFVKLADFGVAHVASGDSATRTGEVVGTLAYMAPEQAEGRAATPACDAYSLALTLYEVWTGTNPVRAAGPAATARRLGRRLPSLGRRRRDLPAGLCAAIDDALDGAPERRPPLPELRAELNAAEDALSDEGGLVEPGTIRRLGLRRARGRALTGDAPLPFPARQGARRAPLLARPAPLFARLAAGAGAGVLVLWALAALGPEPPVPPLAAGGAAALGVALLARLGWLAAAAALCGWLASPGADRAGTALVLAAALAPTPLLLPRAGHLWSAPALAPLLAAAGLGPAFVGVAGLARGPLRRAGLAAAGFLWLAVAELLSGHAYLFGPPDGARPHVDWQASAAGAGREALGPLLGGPALAPLVAWAAFALLLRLAAPRRFPALAPAGAALWAVGLVAAHAGLGDLLAASTQLDHARGAVPGALVAAAAVPLAGRLVLHRAGARAEPAPAP